jgi:hypothetical protein
VDPEETGRVQYPKDTPPFLKLPRSLDPLDDCGLAISWVRCENHKPGGAGHDARPLMRTCGRRECAHDHCDKTWRERLARDAAARVVAAAAVHDAGEIVHVVLSPPPALGRAAFQTTDGYKKLRREARAIAARAGLTGGAIVVHPWRCKFAGHGRYEKAARAGKLEFSPHYHFVGTGWVDWDLHRYRRTGWIVKNLGVRKSTRKTISYLATHCGIVPALPTVTYLGFAHPQKTEVVAERAEQEVALCVGCGGVMVQTDFEMMLDLGSYFERVIHRSYAARGKARDLNAFGQRRGCHWSSNGILIVGRIADERAVPGSFAWFAPETQTLGLELFDVPRTSWEVSRGRPVIA